VSARPASQPIANKAPAGGTLVAIIKWIGNAPRIRPVKAALPNEACC
jgi:hypothetical protein